MVLLVIKTNADSFSYLFLPDCKLVGVSFAYETIVFARIQNRLLFGLDTTCRPNINLCCSIHLHSSTRFFPSQLGVMAYHIENNDSQLMGIKKQEYLRVLANIVNESRQEQVYRTGSVSRAQRNNEQKKQR